VAKKKVSAATSLDKRLDALRGRPKEELAALLAELAATHPEVEERLARHARAADPARLAAEFRKRLQT
jgi:phosphoserine phosphatase